MRRRFGWGGVGLRYVYILICGSVGSGKNGEKEGCLDWAWADDGKHRSSPPGEARAGASGRASRCGRIPSRGGGGTGRSWICTLRWSSILSPGDNSICRGDELRGSLFISSHCIGGFASRFRKCSRACWMRERETDDDDVDTSQSSICTANKSTSTYLH